MKNNFELKGHAAFFVEKALNSIYKAVIDSIGPKGKYAIINDGYRYFVTKDGATIVRHLQNEDPFANSAMEIIKQASLKTNKEVGDGTTSSVMFTKLFYDYLTTSVGTVPENFESILSEILDNNSSKITSEIEAIKVATVSCAGDEELGKLIGETMFQLRHSGIVEITSSNKNEDYVEYFQGSRYVSSYVSPVFITNSVKQIVELDNPYIHLLATKAKSFTDPTVNENDTIAYHLNKAHSMGKPFLLVAPEFSEEVLDITISNLNNGVKIYLAYAPGFGQTRIDNLTDIQILTYNKELGYCTAEKVIISNSNLDIINPLGEEKEKQARSLYIQQRILNEEDPEIKLQLRERYAVFNGQSGKINIYAKTKAEYDEKIARVDDAVCAVRTALTNGYVPGAGYIYSLLYHHFMQRNDTKEFATIFENAVNILYSYFDIDFTPIHDNQYIYNASTENLEEITDTTILEPRNVVYESIMNGLSIAKLLSKIHVIVDFEPQKLKL